MDLEGVANVLLDAGVSEGKIIERLSLEIATFKSLGEKRAEKLAESILKEVKASRAKAKDGFVRHLLSAPTAGATMHDLGVGCRGGGDFFVHKLIAGIAGLSGNALLLPGEQDDAGAVGISYKAAAGRGTIIASAVDGTHSRLSNFPFIAGFHVARAAMRDVIVKGARPVALIDDLHLADDGDVGKLFDFVAGISAVGKLAGVPLVSGSTLRVGGDMVIGTRMVSCAGCIGVAKRLLRRADVKNGDAIIMTQGAGGGTVATAAIYSGQPDAAKETINVDFITAANAIIRSKLIESVHCMLDVTNGGLRGDANEVCETAGVGIELWEDRVRSVVNPRVLSLLEGLGIDYLGVSLDSLLVFCPQEEKAAVMGALKKRGVNAAEVGRVVKGRSAKLDGELFAPKFRESAYTEVKKLDGECEPGEYLEFKRGAEKAAREAEEKMRAVVEHVMGSGRGGKKDA